MPHPDLLVRSVLVAVLEGYLEGRWLPRCVFAGFDRHAYHS